MCPFKLKMSVSLGRVAPMFGLRTPARGAVGTAGGRHALRPGAHRDGRALSGRTFAVAGVTALGVLLFSVMSDPSAVADEVAPVVPAPQAPSVPGPATAQEGTYSLHLPASARSPLTKPKSVAVKKPAPAKLLVKSTAHNVATKRASRAGRRGTKPYNLAYARNYSRLVVGWDSAQFSCLNKLWTGESNWRPMAKNRRSGAYGIPQALPGHKMRSAGNDWKTNPDTQIRWGVKYIKIKYQTPCKALKFKRNRGWY